MWAQVALDALEKFFFGDDFWMVLLGWVDGLGVDRRGNAPHVLFHSVGYGKSETQNSEHGKLSCASNDSFTKYRSVSFTVSDCSDFPPFFQGIANNRILREIMAQK